MIHVIGTGPVGLLMASLLKDQGHSPVIVGKTGRAEPYLKFAKTDVTGKVTQYAIAYRHWEALPPASISFALICTKARDALQAYHQAVYCLQKEGQVVFLNNGMGPQQAAMQLTPAMVLIGSNTHGAYLEANGGLVHAGIGSVVLGSEYASAPIANLPHGFLWAPDMRPILWRKLGINALINPLSVIYQCQNGDLATLPHARARLARMAVEVDQIAARSAGISELSSEQAAIEVARQTANNWSSTMQDYRAGKPNELPYILGYLLEAAAKEGLSCPQLSLAFQETSTMPPYSGR
jgi:2-dehydropantoate 2-reductase